MKRYFRILTLLSLLLFGSFRMAAETWTATDIPMVHLQDALRYVCDPEHLMSEIMRDSVDSYARRLEKECGIESVWVVVSNVEGGDVFRVAEDIGNKIGVGNKKTNRGLVVVIAVDDRKYFIAPGEGLEGDLTDVECDDIAKACIVKNMRKGDLDEAVLSTVKAVYSKFKTGNTGIEADEELGITDVFGIIIFFVLIGLILFRIWHDNTRGGGRGRRNRRGGNPWFFFGDFGGSGGSNGPSGGSFGGGSFGGGGSGGGW